VRIFIYNTVEHVCRYSILTPPAYSPHIPGVSAFTYYTYFVSRIVLFKMRLSSSTSQSTVLIGALLFSTTAVADFDIWSGTCTTGLDPNGGSWDTWSAATYAQGGCGGYSVGGSPIPGREFTAKNPCNTADEFTALPNGQTWNLYLRLVINQLELNLID
jgi:hypothetical protein